MTMMVSESDQLLLQKWHLLHSNILFPALLKLTNEKLLRIKQFTWLLLLQLVGLIHIRSQRSFPVNPALTEALGVHPIWRHPQQHPSLQDIGKHLGPLSVGLRVRKGKQDDFWSVVKPVVGTRRRRGGWWGSGWSNATSFWARGGHLFYQRLSVEQGHVQAEVCKWNFKCHFWISGRSHFRSYCKNNI